MSTHELKTWPEHFSEIVTGRKTSELRKNDRNFQQGDVLFLREYDPRLQIYTGLETRVLVMHMLEKFKGLEKGYCVLSIRLQPGQCTNFSAGKAGKR